MKKNRMWSSVGLACVLALLAFNFTVVGKYTSYPWWHQHDCDSDPLYVAQAVTLVNDGPLDYIHHPGATVSSGHGLAYRVASTIAGWHPEYLNVRASVQGLSGAEILEDAVRFSRRMSFVIFAVFIATLYGFIFWLSRNAVITVLITFFVATSQVGIWHSRAIRPEIPSLLFSVLALWALLALTRNLASGEDRRFALGSIAFGFCLALSMFSKIQVLPVVAALLLLGIGTVLTINPRCQENAMGSRLWASFVLGLTVAVLTPWWALGRPDFVTESYVRSVGYFDRLAYGSMVDTFVPVVAGVLGVSLSGTLTAILINRRQGESRVFDRLAVVFGFVHLVMLGSLIGVYTVLAPASRSFSSYVGNTHHLVYVVFANSFGNVFGTGFLHHKTVDGNTVTRIFDAHGLGDRMLGVNISWLVILVAIIVIIRMVAPKTSNLGEYGLSIFLLVIGVVMDVVFTLRWNAQFNYYAIFSLVFYGTGMALFLKLEWQNLWVERGWRSLTYGVAILLCGLLVSHVGFRTYGLLTAPRATGISDQTPVPMLESTLGQNPHFWGLFEESP